MLSRRDQCHKCTKVKNIPRTGVPQLTLLIFIKFSNTNISVKSFPCRLMICVRFWWFLLQTNVGWLLRLCLSAICCNGSCCHICKMWRKLQPRVTACVTKRFSGCLLTRLLFCCCHKCIQNVLFISFMLFQIVSQNIRLNLMFWDTFWSNMKEMNRAFWLYIYIQCIYRV